MSKSLMEMKWSSSKVNFELTKNLSLNFFTFTASEIDLEFFKFADFVKDKTNVSNFFFDAYKNDQNMLNEMTKNFRKILAIQEIFGDKTSTETLAIFSEIEELETLIKKSAKLDDFMTKNLTMCRGGNLMNLIFDKSFMMELSQKASDATFVGLRTTPQKLIFDFYAGMIFLYIQEQSLMSMAMSEVSREKFFEAF